ncbi:MAG: alpha/beta hydrolase [Bacteroidia bacterium]|nr:alpha/beta hydrolase [Bacteroidia bacterium]
MLKIPCNDGFQLAASHFPAKKEEGKVLIINSATAVDRKLYFHYANWLAGEGYEVFTYDYRGIAESRPRKLRGFKTSFRDWGEKDFPAVISHARSVFPRHKLFVLGHSIGGTLTGMSESLLEIDGLLTIASQTAYYKDWAPGQRGKIFFLWHLFLPAMTAIFGYFPGKRLGILEDVPKGVINEWKQRRKEADLRIQMKSRDEQIFYENYKGKLLSLGLYDDPIGTEAAIQRMHQWYSAADKEIKVLQHEEEIGHFGFFRRKFRESLWPISLDFFESC